LIAETEGLIADHEKGARLFQTQGVGTWWREGTKKGIPTVEGLFVPKTGKWEMKQ
jgi:hypothetical protein